MDGLYCVDGYRALRYVSVVTFILQCSYDVENGVACLSRVRQEYQTDNLVMMKLQAFSISAQIANQ